jgi:hypothetical protein
LHIITGLAGADTFKVGDGDDTITDYNQADGDIVDISHVLDTSDTYDVTEGLGGKAKLVIQDGAGHEKGSVTFDNINYGDLDTGHELDSLLEQVEIDDDPTG